MSEEYYMKKFCEMCDKIREMKKEQEKADMKKFCEMCDKIREMMSTEAQVINEKFDYVFEPELKKQNGRGWFITMRIVCNYSSGARFDYSYSSGKTKKEALKEITKMKKEFRFYMRAAEQKGISMRAVCNEAAREKTALICAFGNLNVSRNR